MQHRLNKQLRKLTLALALPLSVTALHGCDFFHPTTDAQYVAKARAAKDSGDLKASIINLKNALLNNPDNLEARLLLGEINVTARNWADAEKELRKAIDLGAKREYMLPSLAKALLFQKKNQQVIDEINAPDILLPEEKANLMAYRGEAWIGLNKPSQAKAEFDQALATDAKCGLALLGLARLALAGGELDKALQLAKEAVDATPDEATAWGFLAELYQTKGDLTQAEASYSKAIGLPSANPGDRASRALLRIQMKKTKEADQDIEILKNEAPNFFLTHFAAGLLELAQQKYPEAQTSLETTLRLNERYVQAQYFLAASQIQQQHWEQAEGAISSFLKVFPNSVKGHQLMASLKFQQKDYAAAKKYIAPVVAQMPEDVFSLKILMNSDFALGNNVEGMAHLKKLAELEPKSPETKAQLGLGLLRAGQKEEGLKDLQAAVEMDPNLIQADAYIAMTYIQGKQYEQAQAVIDKLRKKMPAHPFPLDLEGMLHASKGDMENAKRSFEKALEIEPTDLTASNNLAQLAQKENNPDKARELYQQILKSHPKHVSAYLALAELEAGKGDLKQIESYLKQAIQTAPNEPQARIVLARLYTRIGQATQAVTLLEPIQAEQGGNPEFQTVLAEAQLENKNGMQALESAKKLLKASPKSALAHYLLAAAYWENGDARNMRASLDASLKLDAKFFRSRLAMVRLLTQEQKNDDAKKYLDTLKTEFPENPEVLDLLGWFATRQGKPEEASKFYQTGLEKFPSSQFAISLAQAQWAAGHKDLALATLEQWTGKHPKDASARYILSSLYSGMNQPDNVIAQLKAILEINPDNAQALNDLAWLIRKEKPAEAKEYAEKAMSLAPKFPDAIDTLAMILLEKGEKDRALALMKQAYSLAPKRLDIHYHLAQAYQRCGQTDEAKRTLAELLKEPVKFKDRQEAEQLLNLLNQ